MLPRGAGTTSSSMVLHSHLSRRRLLKGVVSGLGALAASRTFPTMLAPATSLAASPSKKDTVIVGMHQELEFLNVLYTQGGNSLSASKLAQRGLLFLDKASNWTGELATSVPSKQNGGISSDGLTITFRLRQGVTWHDGMPVTSADVKATWNMIMDARHAVVTRYGYDKIKSVETPDPHTAVVVFKEPFASWPVLFDAIVPKHIIDANAANLDKSQAMRQPIGFGPYKIVDWKPSESVSYVAFERYWKGAPKIGKLLIKFYPSVDTLLQAVSVGEVDIAWAMPLSYVPQIRNLSSRGVTLVNQRAANSERYVMNADGKKVPLFADKQLRKALRYAVDKKQIIDKLLYGLADYGTCEWDGSPWQDPKLVKNEYDAAKSQQALDALGWRRGTDGIRVKSGQRLSFTHSTTTGNQLRENVQLLVQQMYKDVGVEMTIKNGRTAELFGTWPQGGWWSRGDFMLGGWSHGLRVPDPEVSNRYLCSEIASESNQAGSQWYHYCNPRVDKLLDAQAREFDPQQRTRLIFEVESILQDDAYWLYLYTVPQIYTAPATLKNFYLHPFANFYWNPQEWEWA